MVNTIHQHKANDLDRKFNYFQKHILVKEKSQLALKIYMNIEQHIVHLIKQRIEIN